MTLLQTLRESKWRTKKGPSRFPFPHARRSPQHPHSPARPCCASSAGTRMSRSYCPLGRRHRELLKAPRKKPDASPRDPRPRPRPHARTDAATPRRLEEDESLVRRDQLPQGPCSKSTAQLQLQRRATVTRWNWRLTCGCARIHQACAALHPRPTNRGWHLLPERRLLVPIRQHLRPSAGDAPAADPHRRPRTCGGVPCGLGELRDPKGT
jgi:hypothetical protein